MQHTGPVHPSAELFLPLFDSFLIINVLILLRQRFSWPAPKNMTGAVEGSDLPQSHQNVNTLLNIILNRGCQQNVFILRMPLSGHEPEKRRGSREWAYIKRPSVGGASREIALEATRVGTEAEDAN